MAKLRHTPGQQSKKDEQALSEYLKRFDILAEAGRPNDFYDFMIYDFKKEQYVAIAEVKRVGKKTHGEHKDTVLPMLKFIELKKAAEALGVRLWFFIWVEGDAGIDRLYLADLTNYVPAQYSGLRDTISLNGRKDRGDKSDIMHLVHIPLNRFTECTEEGAGLL